MFNLAQYTAEPRDASLRAKDAVLNAGGSAAIAAPPQMIRIRRHWGALQALIDELQNASNLDFRLNSHIERLKENKGGTDGEEIEHAYYFYMLEYALLAADQGAFVFSPCVQQRMAEDAFLSTLLPALKPLFGLRFENRDAFERQVRPLLIGLPQLQPGPVPKDEPPGTKPEDRVAQAVARIARITSSWARAYRVRQAVDRVLYPQHYPDSAPSNLRGDLSDIVGAQFDPGQVLRRWFYYDYAGPPVPSGEHDLARYEFTLESVAGVVHTDSLSVPPSSLRRSALSEVDDVEHLLESLAAAEGAQEPTLKAFWDKVLPSARISFGEMRQTIGDWYLLPTAPRLPLLPEETPWNPNGPGIRLDGEGIEHVRDQLGKEELIPAPSYAILFQTDRPSPADMKLAETAQPLTEILQQRSQFDDLVAKLEQLGLEALDLLSIAAHGHTDKSAGETHNQSLSERRAQWLLDRIATRCRKIWRIDQAVLDALTKAGAGACAIEDLTTLSGRPFLHDRSTTLAILTAILGAPEAQRLYPTFEQNAVRPIFSRVEPVIGHGESEASGADDSPQDRKVIAGVTAAPGPAP